MSIGAGLSPPSRPLRVVNHLGPRVGQALRALPDPPEVTDTDEPPWLLPADCDVLVTGPIDTWLRAPPAPPAGWPRGLGWVQLASAGIDFYPDWLRRVPLITLARGLTADDVAEYVMLAILMDEKQAPLPRPQAGSPDPPRFGSARGRTLGLVGLGAIGRATARLARAFGMNVVACRSSAAGDPIDGLTMKPGPEEVFAAADHLVLALPLTAATYRLVDDRMLAHARPGLHLINVARGAIVDQEALVRALDAGRIRAATLDVTDPEPLPADHPLRRRAGVRITPHVAARGAGGEERFIRRLCDNIRRYQAGTMPEDRYDPRKGY